jgi:hypothetical protein
VHVFRQPVEGVYRESRDYRRGEAISLAECGEAVHKVAETGV